MNIELIKAILHVLDPAVDAPILSEAILPPSEDALQYLAGHASQVLCQRRGQGLHAGGRFGLPAALMEHRG